MAFPLDVYLHSLHPTTINAMPVERVREEFMAVLRFLAGVNLRASYFDGSVEADGSL